LSADQGSGLDPPTPPPGRDPRPLNPAKSGPPKGRIFPDFWGLRCSAQGGWGGSAHYPDPTAQSAYRRAPRTCRDSRPRGTGSGAWPGPSGGKKSEKILFFFEEGCVCFGVDEWGCGNRLRRCGRRRRAGPPPPPMAELCEARGGALPGPVPQTGTLPGAGRVSTYGGPRATLRGVGPRLALANGLPLSASATPLRGTAVPCFEGGALPHGYVPPTSAEEALAGPVAAMLPNAPAHV
jgi:hypothetical protein